MPVSALELLLSMYDSPVAGAWPFGICKPVILLSSVVNTVTLFSSLIFFITTSPCGDFISCKISLSSLSGGCWENSFSFSGVRALCFSPAVLLVSGVFSVCWCCFTGEFTFEFLLASLPSSLVRELESGNVVFFAGGTRDVKELWIKKRVQKTDTIIPVKKNLIIFPPDLNLQTYISFIWIEYLKTANFQLLFG